MMKLQFIFIPLALLILSGCQRWQSKNIIIERPFTERVTTCAVDYIADQDSLWIEHELLRTGNTYLSCLYYAMLGNESGEWFPYFIKQDFRYNNLSWHQRLIAPKYQPLYFDQDLINNQLAIPTCTMWNTESKEMIEISENCKGVYDFAHYLISGTVVSDTCYFVGCGEDMPENSECLWTEITYHTRKCFTLVPTYQKNFEPYNYETSDIEIRQRYGYQKHLPLVAQGKYRFEDVHIWRYYGELTTVYAPDSNKIQELETIVDDGEEYLFDIVEVNKHGTDGYGNGVALWKLYLSHE